MYSGYTLLWWPWVYIAGAYLYHYYTLCTLDTHSYDDPGFTLLLIYNTIPYVLWIYIVMMTQGIHCWCLTFITIPYILWIHIVMMILGIHCWRLTISLYLMYPGYTLLCWPWVTLLVLFYITIIPFVPWIHIFMMTLGIHFWCLSISLLYLMYSGYTFLW